MSQPQGSKLFHFPGVQPEHLALSPEKERSDYDGFRDHRQATDPYFEHVYPQVEPLFDGSEKILDLAAGDGHAHDVFSEELSSRLVSLDVDAEGLDMLRERHPNAWTVQGDVNRLPFDDESFDAALNLDYVTGILQTKRGVREIERVLKPGGIFVFMQDMPVSLFPSAYEQWRVLDPKDKHGMRVVPVINRASQNVDLVGILTRKIIEDPVLAEDLSASMALNAVRKLLGPDWMKKIYEDELTIAQHAKRFARLIEAAAELFGQPVITLGEPITPLVKKSNTDIAFQSSRLSAEVMGIEVNYETDQPHTVNDREVGSLYVDELSLPHLTYRSQVSADKPLRVKGKTPVYIARKPE